MDQITIRTATLADLDTLFTFEQGVISAERPFDPTLKDSHINYYDINHMITAPHIELKVAVIGDEIIGSGYARIEDAKLYLKHPQHAYLGFMYVKPEHRGKGVNQKVIGALQEWAAARGITECRLEVYYDNAPAIRAYEKIGFSKHMILMRMGFTPVLSKGEGV
jgi:ribosomal protein S18 acetylase RimI-like enzyme